MGKKKTINEAFDVQGNYCWKLCSIGREDLVREDLKYNFKEDESLKK